MTGAARHLLAAMAVAAALVVAAAVLLWPSIVKPRTVSPRPPSPTQLEALPDDNGGASEQPKPPALAPVAVHPHVVAGGVASQVQPPVADTSEIPALVAAILQPPQAPSPPPPRKPAEVALEQGLSGAIAHNPGSELTFVACDEDGAPCRARLQAGDLGTVAAAAREASVRYEGHVDIKLHEQVTAYNGRIFVAELQVGTKEPRAVPSDTEPYP
jgi:hypothetical protein